MHKVWLITKREYLRTVKKKSFWLSTVLMPIFIVVVSLISGSSGQMMEDMVAQGANDLSRVLIMDGTGLLAPEGLPDNIVFVEDKAAAQEEVRSKAASAFIYIPSSILDSKGEIYTADSDLLSGDTLSNMVNNLLDSSVINSIEDPIKVQLLTTDITFDVTTLTENGDSEFNIANFIAPAVVVIVYILLISFGSSYLLLSVAEEKENRMIEIVMSLITPKELILGKLIGLLGVVLTQILVLTGMSIAGLMLVGTQIPLDMLSGIEISAGQILMSVFYLFAGFLILANTMVGVGAAMPTYREAQSFSSVFILLGMYPLWLVGLLMTDPSGPVAMFSSYFPFSSAMVLLFRNALGEISSVEMLFSTFVLLIYVILSFLISYKLFEIGALEYHQRLSLKTVVDRIRRIKKRE